LTRIGARVTVVEAYQDPGGEVGSFVSLATNGLRALDALGCGDRVRAHGFPVARQRMWSGSGKLLGDVARGRVASDPMHSVTLMRGHLVAELRAVAQETGVGLVTGVRVEGAEEGPEGVRVRLSDGTTHTADLLVGADGIWSATRRLLDPAAPTPEYAGVYVVSGRATGGPGDDGAFNLVFARNGAFIHLRAPDGEVWWQAQVNSGTQPQLEGMPEEQLLRRVKELFGSDHAPGAVLSGVTRVHRPSVNHMLAPVQRWRGERTLLIGDAAHPVGAGQGASMAIEDGLDLIRRRVGSRPAWRRAPRCGGPGRAVPSASRRPRRAWPARVRSGGGAGRWRRCRDRGRAARPGAGLRARRCGGRAARPGRVARGRRNTPPTVCAGRSPGGPAAGRVGRRR
jgi:salicylate hydroxylase